MALEIKIKCDNIYCHEFLYGNCDLEQDIDYNQSIQALRNICHDIKYYQDRNYHIRDWNWVFENGKYICTDCIQFIVRYHQFSTFSKDFEKCLFCRESYKEDYCETCKQKYFYFDIYNKCPIDAVSESKFSNLEQIIVDIYTPVLSEFQKQICQEAGGKYKVLTKIYCEKDDFHIEFETSLKENSSKDKYWIYSRIIYWDDIDVRNGAEYSTIELHAMAKSENLARFHFEQLNRQMANYFSTNLSKLIKDCHVQNVSR